MASNTPKLLLVVSLLLWVQRQADAAAVVPWSYDRDHAKGPDHWDDHFSNCGGRMQSPINIDTHDLQYDPELKAIHMTGYESSPGGEWSLSNNGFTIAVALPDGITIEGAGLDGKFKAAQFHFHWGSTNDHGSEHTVDGHKYPMELHIVHYNVKYGSLKKAMEKHQGLAVMGVFVEIGDFNPYFQALTDKLPNVHDKGSITSMRPLDLRHMLPRGLHNYYRYDGSLTTPPCYETVEWTVFEETVKVSQAQMDAFRDVQFDSDPKHPHPMVDNYRDPQPVGRRNVFTSEAEDDPEGWDDDFHENWAMIGGLVLLFFCLGRFTASSFNSGKFFEQLSRGPAKQN